MSAKGKAARLVLRGLNALLARQTELYLLPRRGTVPGQLYSEDGLHTDANHEFVDDPDFVRAYARGVQAAGWDYGIRWRVYVALWVAAAGSRVWGDYVECGVGRGMVTSAVLQSLPWDRMDRRFVLIDTFSPFRVGTDGAQDETSGVSDFYAPDVESVRANFAEWPRVELVQGAIPEVLAALDVEQVAYLHVDLNAPEPERAALEHFWPRLSPGAFVLLDDYGFAGDHVLQKRAADQFAASVGTQVLSLPTGQGLIAK